MACFGIQGIHKQICNCHLQGLRAFRLIQRFFPLPLQAPTSEQEEILIQFLNYMVCKCF